MSRVGQAQQLPRLACTYGTWCVPGSGSNYPLRGYKLSNFEGGTRVPAFVSGGLLPAAVRGKPAEGLAAMYDWSATFYALAGVGVPASGIDGVNLWPWLSGEQPSSPRAEVRARVCSCVRVFRLSLAPPPSLGGQPPQGLYLAWAMHRHACSAPYGVSDDRPSVPY